MTRSRRIIKIKNSRVGEITIFTIDNTCILTIGPPGASYSIHFTREEFRGFVEAADSVIPLGYRYPDDNAQEPTHSLKAKGFGWSVTAC